MTVHIEARTGLLADLTFVGPDGKVIENKGPTEDQIALTLAAKYEPLRRALIFYCRSKQPDWVNLYRSA
jgi:hypothetical protein